MDTMAARDTQDDSRARGAPEKQSHHEKYRSQYPSSIDARSRERGASRTPYGYILCKTRLTECYSFFSKNINAALYITTRTEKLWVLFHRFSLEDGIEICKARDFALNLSSPETFWQLLLEKEFLKALTMSEQAGANKLFLRSYIRIHLCSPADLLLKKMMCDIPLAAS